MEEKKKAARVTVLYPNGITDSFTVGGLGDNTKTVTKIETAPEDANYDYVVITFSDGEKKVFGGFHYIFTFTK